MWFHDENKAEFCFAEWLCYGFRTSAMLVEELVAVRMSAEVLAAVHQRVAACSSGSVMRESSSSRQVSSDCHGCSRRLVQRGAVLMAEGLAEDDTASGREQRAACLTAWRCVGSGRPGSDYCVS